MGCYAKVNVDKRNVTAADNVTTGDNDHGRGGVGAPPTRRMTTTTTTRAAAAAVMTTTGGLRNTSATATVVQYWHCWGRSYAH